MDSKSFKRTLYPQWHKKYVSSNPELEKKVRQFQKEASERKKQELEKLKKKRLDEYTFIDDKQYYFTWDDFQNYLVNSDFNIEKCYIPNIIEKEKHEEGERLKREEEERLKREEEERKQLEYLQNYQERDYLDYFYEGESFIVSDSEENYNYSDKEVNYWSDDNLY